tara:strand:- start:116 stop:349 length:234 start_codon:yes stop_codon:yes gene_type:complete
MSADKPIQQDKRMYDNHKEHGEDLSYENEQSMVTIPLKEYDKLKDQSKYITDDTLISAIDKIEFFVKELRKHIVRKF